MNEASQRDDNNSNDDDNNNNYNNANESRLALKKARIVIYIINK